jgi:DNA-binding NarL/FixJ family response regulator
MAISTRAFSWKEKEMPRAADYSIVADRRARAWLEGDQVMRRPGTRPSPVGTMGLTPRELEVLRHVAEGRTNAQIAANLYITEKTADAHVSNILRKLGAARRTEAVAIAHRLGYIDGF